MFAQMAACLEESEEDDKSDAIFKGQVTQEEERPRKQGYEHQHLRYRRACSKCVWAIFLVI